MVQRSSFATEMYRFCWWLINSLQQPTSIPPVRAGSIALGKLANVRVDKLSLHRPCRVGGLVLSGGGDHLFYGRDYSPVLNRSQRSQRSSLCFYQSFHPADIEALVRPIAAQRAQMLTTL